MAASVVRSYKPLQDHIHPFYSLSGNRSSKESGIISAILADLTKPQLDHKISTKPQRFFKRFDVQNVLQFDEASVADLHKLMQKNILSNVTTFSDLISLEFYKAFQALKDIAPKTLAPVLTPLLDCQSQGLLGFFCAIALSFESQAEIPAIAQAAKDAVKDREHLVKESLKAFKVLLQTTSESQEVIKIFTSLQNRINIALNLLSRFSKSDECYKLLETPLYLACPVSVLMNPNTENFEIVCENLLIYSRLLPEIDQILQRTTLFDFLKNLPSTHHLSSIALLIQEIYQNRCDLDRLKQAMGKLEELTAAALHFFQKSMEFRNHEIRTYQAKLSSFTTLKEKRENRSIQANIDRSRTELVHMRAYEKYLLQVPVIVKQLILCQDGDFVSKQDCLYRASCLFSSQEHDQPPPPSLPPLVKLHRELDVHLKRYNKFKRESFPTTSPTFSIYQESLSIYQELEGHFKSLLKRTTRELRSYLSSEQQLSKQSLIEESGCLFSLLYLNHDIQVILGHIQPQTEEVILQPFYDLLSLINRESSETNSSTTADASEENIAEEEDPFNDIIPLLSDISFSDKGVTFPAQPLFLPKTSFFQGTSINDTKKMHHPIDLSSSIPAGAASKAKGLTLSKEELAEIKRTQTSATLIKKLQELGLTSVRTRGSHVVLKHPTLGISTTVPDHSTDLKRGTLQSILRQLGLVNTEEEAFLEDTTRKRLVRTIHQL